MSVLAIPPSAFLPLPMPMPMPRCLLPVADLVSSPPPPPAQVPAFFVVTKIDLAPEHVLKHTLQTLSGILKKPGVRKRPFLVRGAG